MRIAYVTAHLPPDFTSGATLLVERLAREAARRGHQVEVFSGAIRQGLADGATRTDPATDERPFATRWIGTATRVDQDIDGNWDNALAAAAAADWLREFRPDVVHMHTLQTLGVGVVEAAVEAASGSGARTVVTMHDLWWWCSRLFLVDTQLRPCPLVTDIGTCACARSASWRRDRAERLGRALDGVDRILAPSSVLRDVIVANGVDSDRVLVDENHVADAVAASVAGSRRGPVAGSVPGADAGADTETPVRLLYLGGNSPLKGADVVRVATRQLAADPAVDVGDWRLTAYGLDPDPGAPMPASVQLLAPFDAADVVEVMAAHDVLVLPSLARESFSIAAREALAAGLAVVTSDCLGPEEVVIDDVNGMVVPTGNATALADAVRSLVSDRTMLARLRAGAATAPVSLRTAADHVTALLEIYTAAPPVRSASHGRRVGFIVGVDGEPARFRVHHPRVALARAGDALGPIAHHLDPGLDQTMRGCDVVVVQQAPATPDLSSLIQSLRGDGVLVVFDVADAGIELESRAIASCDGAIAATPEIAERTIAATGVPTAVVPDAAGLVEMQLAELARTSPLASTPARTPALAAAQAVRVGYVGSSSSDQADVDLIEPVLVQLLRRHRQVEFVMIGPCEPSAELAAFGARMRHLDTPAWRELPGVLRQLDINLAPVAPERERGGGPVVLRSWLAASLVEVATIASASPSAGVIDHGRTGLVCSSLPDWVAALDGLVGDALRRSRLGAAARRELDLHHGPHLTARRYRDVFDSFDTRAALDERPMSPPPDADVAELERSVVPLASYDLGDAIIGDVSVGAGTLTDDDRRGLVGRLGRKVRRAGGAALRRVLPG